MYVFISIMIVLVSLCIILIVLVQNSKGGGLAAGFSSSNQIMGVRKTNDFLDKATWSLAAVLIILSVGISAFIPKAKSANESAIEKQVNETSTVDPNAVTPDFGTATKSDAPAAATTDAPATSETKEK